MKIKVFKGFLFIFYSTLLAFVFYLIGVNSPTVIETKNTAVSVPAKNEEYMAIEEEGRLLLYQDGEKIMALDTNIEMLPSVVRSQLKKGVEFNLNDLPMILEAFAE